MIIAQTESFLTEIRCPDISKDRFYAGVEGEEGMIYVPLSVGLKELAKQIEDFKVGEVARVRVTVEIIK